MLQQAFIAEPARRNDRGEPRDDAFKPYLLIVREGGDLFQAELRQSARSGSASRSLPEVLAEKVVDVADLVLHQVDLAR